MALGLNELVAMIEGGRAFKTDSRLIEPGDVFIAIPGAKNDGGKYVGQALKLGAAFAVVSRDAVLSDIPEDKVIPVEDARDALGQLCSVRYKTADVPMKVVGVTGTNGKTTIAYMIERLCLNEGMKPGILGTVSYRWPGFEAEANLTTPDCESIHRYLGRMSQAGVDVACMEVSSHALDQKRVAGVKLDAAVFTNLTQDHLDYHKDMESYFQAKKRLFTDMPRPEKAWIINTSDEYGRRLAEAGMNAGAGIMAYSLDKSTGFDGVYGRITSLGSFGTNMEITCGAETVRITTPMIGRHNALNALAAVATGVSLGLGLTSAGFLENFYGAPGRLERVGNDSGLSIFVDYAHTPDALLNVASSLKDPALGFKRLVVLFGCGGNRDRTKRPLMAQAVARFADVAVLTSDNPRDEDPLAIMADAKPGLSGCSAVIEEPDRRTAISRAISVLEKDDVLLIAGKGHETTQTIAGIKHPFSDVVVAREFLRCA